MNKNNSKAQPVRSPDWKWIDLAKPEVAPPAEEGERIDCLARCLARTSGLAVLVVYTAARRWTVRIGRDEPGHPEHAIARNANFAEAEAALNAAFETVNLFRLDDLSVVVESRDGVVEQARAYLTRRRALADIHGIRIGMKQGGTLMDGCGPDEAIDDVNEREVICIDAALDA